MSTNGWSTVQRSDFPCWSYGRSIMKLMPPRWLKTFVLFILRCHLSVCLARLGSFNLKFFKLCCVSIFIMNVPIYEIICPSISGEGKYGTWSFSWCCECSTSTSRHHLEDCFKGQIAIVPWWNVNAFLCFLPIPPPSLFFFSALTLQLLNLFGRIGGQKSRQNDELDGPLTNVQHHQSNPARHGNFFWHPKLFTVVVPHVSSVCFIVGPWLGK